MPSVSTHQYLMSVHWARKEERSVMWSMELVTKYINGGNALDVVLSAEVGRQEATKLHQCVMALHERKRQLKIKSTLHVHAQIHSFNVTTSLFTQIFG